ncbi:Hpt domain-containing protein [Cognatishimia sp. WU-CL00825]|uniref:Hpt domain-containing protein n=1 Tax=Cognatishimia sp. WU-CL00825 TaxID=3127658 RepID=UPI003107D4DA
MIDWARLADLQAEIGADDFAAVVEIFLEEVDEAIAVLGKNPQREHLESALHFLKGSALNLGFKEFAKLCQIGELTASRGQADGIDLPEILECYQKSRGAFLAGLAQHTA